MRQFLIVGLFAILLGDLMLGLGLGLAPGLSLKNALLYILFIALILDITVGGRDLLPEAWGAIAGWLALIGYALFTWLAISLLGLHRGYGMFESFVILKNQLVDLFLFFMLFLYGPRSAAQALSLAKWLVGALVVANLITFLDVYNIPDLGIMVDRPDSRVAGPVGGVNQYGAILAFIIPITAGFSVGSRGWTKRFFQIGTLVALMMLGLTISRGAFVGLVTGVVVTLIAVRKYISGRALRRGLLFGFLCLILVAAAVAFHDPAAFFARFDISAAKTVTTISSGRTDIWSRALTMISQSPGTVITGFGWNAYATLFLGYGDPHNVYLQYFFNLGILGLGMFLYIVSWVYRMALSALKNASPQMKPLFIGFIMGWVSVLAAVFFVGLYLPWLFIWAVTGTLVRMLIEANRDADSTTKIMI